MYFKWSDLILLAFLTNRQFLILYLLIRAQISSFCFFQGNCLVEVFTTHTVKIASITWPFFKKRNGLQIWLSFAFKWQVWPRQPYQIDWHKHSTALMCNWTTQSSHYLTTFTTKICPLFPSTPIPEPFMIHTCQAIKALAMHNS